MTPQQSVVRFPTFIYAPMLGVRCFYAEPDRLFQLDPDIALDQEEESIRDVAEKDERYCLSCQIKRNRDRTVKRLIRKLIRDRKRMEKREYLWDELLYRLRDIGYDLPRMRNVPLTSTCLSGLSKAKTILALSMLMGTVWGSVSRIAGD